jgi:hypothetical protein
MTTAAAAEPPIHELLLENLFALMRDGRVAVLHTLLTAQG